MSQWFIYILVCADNTLYTGITTDIKRRINTHNNAKGAKYTRVRLPVKLMYQEGATDRSNASKREAQIKKLTRAQKLALIQSVPLI